MTSKIAITRIESTVTRLGRKIAWYQFPNGEKMTYEQCLTIWNEVQPNDIDTETWAKRGKAKHASRYQVRQSSGGKWNAGDIAKEILTDKLTGNVR